jgi:transposase
VQKTAAAATKILKSRSPAIHSAILSSCQRRRDIAAVLVAAVGRNGLQRLITILGNADDDRVPAVARASLTPLVCQFDLVNDQVLENDRRVRASARFTEVGLALLAT